MLLAMLALLVILAWLAVLLLDWMLPRAASKRKVLKSLRRASRGLHGWKFSDAETDGLPLRHGSDPSERNSERDTMLGHIVTRSRSSTLNSSAPYSRRGSTQAADAGKENAGVVDVEKGNVDWKNIERMEARRRSGAV